jgi:hypothetical protein
VDRGAGVNGHPGRERGRDLRVLSGRPPAGGRRADETVLLALQIRQVPGAQWLAGEAPEGRDVVAVSADV